MTVERAATTMNEKRAMTRQYFGTDGVRGRVGEAPITPELVLKLGWAAAAPVTAITSDHSRSERGSVRPRSSRLASQSRAD